MKPIEDIAQNIGVPAAQLALQCKIQILATIVGTFAVHLKAALARRKLSVVGIRMSQRVDRVLDPGPTKRSIR